MSVCENPIHIFEPTPLQCGQAVLAMLTGKRVDEIIEVVGTERETTLKQMFYALDYYSSNVYDILHIPFGELIICGVLLVVPAVISFALIAKNKGRELE